VPTAGGRAPRPRSGYKVFTSYEEEASAAKKRPEHERMMKDAKRGAFQVLVIWALDRFGRSMTGNLADVLELDRVGVQVVSVRESWLDTGSPVRTLLLAIFSWLAEQERVRIGERTRARMAAARRREVESAPNSSNPGDMSTCGGHPVGDYPTHPPPTTLDSARFPTCPVSMPSMGCIQDGRFRCPSERTTCHTGRHLFIACSAPANMVIPQTSPERMHVGDAEVWRDALFVNA